MSQIDQEITNWVNSLSSEQMKKLADCGLVRRLDDQKPIAWLITPKGLEAIDDV